MRDKQTKYPENHPGIKCPWKKTRLHRGFGLHENSKIGHISCLHLGLLYLSFSWNDNGSFGAYRLSPLEGSTQSGQWGWKEAVGAEVWIKGHSPSFSVSLSFSDGPGGKAASWMRLEGWRTGWWGEWSWEKGWVMWIWYDAQYFTECGILRLGVTP